MDKKIITQQIRNISNSSSAIVLSFCFLSLIIQKIIVSFATFVNLPYDVTLLILYCILYLIIIPLILLAFYKTRGKNIGLNLKSTFCKPKVSIGWTIKWIIIGFSALYLSNYISTFLFWILQQVTGKELFSPDINFGNSTIGIITNFLALPIFAPLFEELMFRATIYRNNEPMGQFFAMIVSGLMFGLWHQNYSQFLYASVMGVVACLLFAKTRSIFPSIILHFMVNTLAAIESLALNQIDTDIFLNSKEIPSPDYIMEHIVSFGVIMLCIFCVFALLITGIVLFIIEIVTNRKMLVLQKNRFNLSAFERTLIYFTSPITLITLIFTITMTVIHALS